MPFLPRDRRVLEELIKFGKKFVNSRKIRFSGNGMRRERSGSGGASCGTREINEAKVFGSPKLASLFQL
jgi:hypothetical protein